MSQSIQSHFRQLEDREFIGISNIDRSGHGIWSFHQAHHTVNQIITVAETAGLTAVTIDGNILILQCLQNKVADHPAIIGMHPGTIGIENPNEFDGKTALHPVAVEQRFGTTLALIIAGPYANGIDVAPVFLDLRMNERITVNLTGGCLQILAFNRLANPSILIAP